MAPRADVWGEGVEGRRVDVWVHDQGWGALESDATRHHETNKGERPVRRTNFGRKHRGRGGESDLQETGGKAGEMSSDSVQHRLVQGMRSEARPRDMDHALLRAFKTAERQVETRLQNTKKQMDGQDMEAVGRTTAQVRGVGTGGDGRGQQRPRYLQS